MYDEPESTQISSIVNMISKNGVKKRSERMISPARSPDERAIQAGDPEFLSPYAPTVAVRTSNTGGSMM